MSTSDRLRSGIAVIAERAVHEQHKAERLEQRPAYDPTDARFKLRESVDARHEAARLIVPPPLVGNRTTEMIPAIPPGQSVSTGRFVLQDTLKVPDTISVDASEHRASLALRANVLSAALDTARTAKASNSIEKMVCHQMAACHERGMEMLIRSRDSFGRLQPGEEARLTNAATRLFEVVQSAALTLQKLKTGGRQHVVVQYQQSVKVSKGGQAVVGNKLVKRGSRKARGKSKNDQ